MKELINKLLVMTKSADIGMQIVNSILDDFKDSIPQDFVEKFREKVAEDAEGFVTILSGVYERHFTKQDVEDLILFYESPIGKKYIEKMPLVTQDSMRAGQEWGAKIANLAMQELDKI